MEPKEHTNPWWKPVEFVQACYLDTVSKRLRAGALSEVEDPRTSSVPAQMAFSKVLADLQAMHDKKNQDYGRPVDPYANVRGSVEWGIKPWVGAMVRANDKIKRLQKFAQDGHLANESVEDSFMDLAVYAIIGLILYREEHGG